MIIKGSEVIMSNLGIEDRIPISGRAFPNKIKEIALKGNLFYFKIESFLINSCKKELNF